MTKVVYASQIGAKLDSNVYTGGGTDDTEILQNWLDNVGDAGVHLILDGAALIHGLRLYSNTTIECLNKDCGFYLTDYARQPILCNAHRDFTEIRDRNITLLGGTYNLNCQNQEHDFPCSEEDAPLFSYIDPSVFSGRHWAIGFEFFGVENLRVEHMTLRDQRTFGMLIANWKYVTMSDICIELPHHIDCRLGSNQDGIHFWGPGQFLTMQNIVGRSGDDFIALAPDEHDGVSSMTDVLIDGVTLDHADQGIRLLSRADGLLDRVVIRNLTGTYLDYGCFIDPYYPSHHSGRFGYITYENIDLRPETPNNDWMPPFLFQIGGSVEHLTLRNIVDHYPESPRTLIEVCGPFYDQSVDTAQTHIKELTVDGLCISQKNGTRVSPILINGVVDRLDLHRVNVTYGEPSDVPFIRRGEKGRIGLLVVNGLIARHIGDWKVAEHTEAFNTYIE